MAENEEHAATYEEEHVHTVYEQIASHFSSTRYKPWPIVERFLLDQPPGSIGIDAGGGNGKYLAVNRHVFMVGSDRSHNLTNIAKAHQPHDAVVADLLALPHPRNTFDFAISIAAIHHLATPARRVTAVAELISTLRPSFSSDQLSSDTQSAARNETSYLGGRALIYVWALEQKDSRRGWDAGQEQDVMVPWVMKTKQQAPKPPKNRGPPRESAPRDEPAPLSNGKNAAQMDATQQDLPQEQVFQRYYHLYSAGELEKDIQEAGGKVIDSGYERDNWWAIAARAVS